MTHSMSSLSAAALGVAAFACFGPLAARADTSPSAATPSLSEPAPTPGWAEGGPKPTGAGVVAPHRMHGYEHGYARHYASNARHYARSSGNFLTDTATGVVGGVADVGSVAAYPFYCFPHYGSCPVRVPYRY